MALLDSEVAQIKYELGYNAMTISAEPLISVVQVFTQVVQPYTQTGASTTSATAVTAATSPTLVTLTLSSATGFTAGDTVVLDADERMESSVCRLVSGSTIALLLSLAHTGTYQVTVQGGEAIIRGILRKLSAISGINDASGGAFDKALAASGVKKVDEIEFFGGGTQGLGAGKTMLQQVQNVQKYWRNELASAIGVCNLREERSSGSVIGVY